MGNIPIGRSKRPTKPHKTSTIREFDGGLNIIDDQLNITPKYSPIHDNLTPGPDGSLEVRPGYELTADIGLEVVTVKGTISVGVTTSSGVSKVVLTIGVHGMTTDDQILIAGASSIGGVPASEINGRRPVNFETSSAVSINTTTVPTTATATQSLAVTLYKKLSWNDIVNITYFQNYLIVADTRGRIIRINSNGVGEIIWSQAIAKSRSGSPNGWGNTSFVWFATAGGKLHAFNGVDKPLEIDNNRSNVVEYLVDPASGSNSAIPAARVAILNNTYFNLAGRTDYPSRLDIGAALTTGVFVGNPSPDDAIDVDMSKQSQAQDPRIVALGTLRNRLVVAFRDAISIGTLGAKKTVGSTEIHEPSFNDQIAEHGCISARTMVSFGNDMFVCDRVGVPSLSQSEISSNIIPERVSDLIEPMVQSNIARLSDAVLQDKVFAVYNSRARQYMLFMPKFDPTQTISLPNNPFSVSDDLGRRYLKINVPGHRYDPGDRFTISGAVPIGNISAAALNRTWEVAYVVDDEYIIVDNGVDFASTAVVGGGAATIITPINDETIGYVYTYNKKLKIKAWTRYRGLNWSAGCVDVFGNVFFSQGHKIYRLGSTANPVYADAVGDYEYTWANNLAISAGAIVKDNTTRIVYKALETHTSPSTGTLQDDIVNNPDRWEEYPGKGIEFEWEWPWFDFDKRVNKKIIKAIEPDVSGKAQFVLDVFSDLEYKSKLNGQYIIRRSIQFAGAAMGGFGVGAQPFGGGRRAKEPVIWPLPVNGKLFKFRFTGVATEPLKFVAVSILYQDGSV